MKRASKWVLLGAFLLLSGARGAAKIAQPDTKEVIVEGVGETPDRAKQEALRTAVEKVTGVFVSSETLIKNAAVVSDKIYTKASGFAIPQEILDQGKKSEGYWVKLRAKVSLQPLADALKSLGLLRQWRLAVLTQEPNQGHIADTGLIKALIEAGFKVVDRERVQQIRNKQAALLALQGDAEAATRVASELGADLLVLGRANASPTSSYGSDNYGGLNISLVAAKGMLSVRVVRAGTGEIIAADTFEGKGVAGNAALSLQKAVADAANNSASFLIQEITKIPASATAIIQLVVGGFSFRDAVALEKALQRVSGVKNIHQEEFSGGLATFELEYAGSSQDLALALEESSALRSFHLQVKEAQKGKIAAEVKK